MNKSGLEILGFKRGGDVMPPRNKKNFRPTKKGAGMTAAGAATINPYVIVGPTTQTTGFGWSTSTWGAST